MCFTCLPQKTIVSYNICLNCVPLDLGDFYRIDIDIVQVAGVAGYLTPVPGGVGPMTVAMLMYNTVQVTKSMNLMSQESNV